MSVFEYVRATDVGEAVAAVSADPAASYLAGGTTQLDLMLKDGVVWSDRLVTPLLMGRIFAKQLRQLDRYMRSGASPERSVDG